MKFNLILEDGGILKNTIIITSKGFARNKHDVFMELKHQKKITVYNKFFKNKIINKKNIYHYEEVSEYKEETFYDNKDNNKDDYILYNDNSEKSIEDNLEESIEFIHPSKLETKVNLDNLIIDDEL